MARQNPSADLRAPGSAAQTNLDQSSDEQRPFAEIRKNLNDVLRILSVHRWAFFVPFCLVTSAAFMMSLYYPRSYEARTSFERRNDPIMVDLPNSPGTQSFRYFRNSMMGDLTSVECMAEVVENLGLTKNYARTENGELAPESIKRRNSLARSLGATVNVAIASPSPQNDIITLTYKGPDPNIGAKLLDELKKAYIRRTHKWIHSFLVSRQDYFQGEVTEARAEFKSAKRDLTVWQMQAPHVDIHNPASIPAKLEDLEMARREMLLRQREHQAQLAAYQQMAMSSTIAKNAQGESQANRGDSLGPMSFVTTKALRLASQVADIGSEIRTLREVRGMRDEHPEIKRLLAKKRLVQEHLDREEATGPESATANASMKAPQGEPKQAITDPVQRTAMMAVQGPLAMEIQREKAGIKDIEIRLQSNKKSMEKLAQAKNDVFQRQAESVDLEAAVSKASKQRQQLTTSLARIEPAIKAIEQGRLMEFSVGEPARGSHIPVNPKATTIVLLALLAGLAAGTVFVILAEILDHVYRGATEVSRSLGLPILDVIDEIVTSGERRRRLITQTVISPLMAICFLAIAGITGTMAYLSIQRPATFERLREIPKSARQWITDSSSSEQWEKIASTVDVSDVDIP